jgi:histidinol-phosphate/aromatic aminotransferase/cobyric acid decarboxylase-like protein
VCPPTYGMYGVCAQINDVEVVTVSVSGNELTEEEVLRSAASGGESESRGLKRDLLVCPPTYGMYGVCAQINDVEVVKVNLDVEGGAFKSITSSEPTPRKKWSTEGTLRSWQRRCLTS